MNILAARPLPLPWRNRRGELSWLKLAAFTAVLAPGLWITAKLLLGQMGPKPVDAALHETGSWAVRLLLATLAITPWRIITGDNRVLAIRRMLGVSVLAYTLIHLALYIVQMRYDLVVVVLEIVKRFYLTIGFVSLAMMAALGATSFDAAVRRMGAEKWAKLHRLIWPLALLAVLHAFIQAKIDITEKVIEAGLILALIAVRVMRNRVAINPFSLLFVAICAGLMTVVLEYGWYAAFTGVPAHRVFQANLIWDLQPRPGLAVFLIALALPLLTVLRRRDASAAARGRVRPLGNQQRSE